MENGTFVLPVDYGKNKKDRLVRSGEVLARIYCAFSAIWSLGANLHEASTWDLHGIGCIISLAPQPYLNMRGGNWEGPKSAWVVGLWGCGVVGLWGCGVVGLWGCGVVGQWEARAEVEPLADFHWGVSPFRESSDHFCGFHPYK